MKKRKYSTAAAAVILTGGLLLSGCAQGQAQTAGGIVQVQNVENQVISVSCAEEVKVVPDMAEIVYAVYTQAKDAKECQENNGKDVTKVVELLKGMGLEERSIQTSNYDLNPMYDWNAGQKIIGYEMETTVKVSDISIDQVGSIISESVDAGVNNIRSISYLSSKYEEAYQEALKKAVEAAKAKAAVLAEAGNAKLGEVVNIKEYNSNQDVRYTGYMSGGGNRAAKEEAAMDMGAVAMPGEVSVEASITVDFAVNR